MKIAKPRAKGKMNPEEEMIMVNRQFNIIDKEREEEYRKNYGKEPGRFTDRDRG